MITPIAAAAPADTLCQNEHYAPAPTRTAPTAINTSRTKSDAAAGAGQVLVQADFQDIRQVAGRRGGWRFTRS